VPLVDVITVTFVAPFMVTFIAALVLRETVGFRRCTAVDLGFVGVLIMSRPGLGVVHTAVFLILIAALLFAL
jgi:drug/metabolite transporter (DMT)-like permease